jgi:hypothetical protein
LSRLRGDETLIEVGTNPSHRLLRRHSGYRFRRRLRGLARAFASGELRPVEVRSRIASWVGHAEHADTWGLRRAIFDPVRFKPGENIAKRDRIDFNLNSV